MGLRSEISRTGNKKAAWLGGVPDRSKGVSYLRATSGPSARLVDGTRKWSKGLGSVTPVSGIDHVQSFASAAACRPSRELTPWGSV